MTRRVLVTDGDERSSLATVRSLGRAGHSVYVVSARPRSLAGGSRHAAEEHRVPDPLEEPTAYTEAIAERVGSWNVDVLLPMSEASLHALLPARQMFAGTKVPFPDYRSFTAVCDKGRVLEEARDIGIEVPRQRVIDRAGEAVETDDSLRFPVVLKPSRSVVPSPSGGRKTSIVYADDHEAMRRSLCDLPEAAFPVLVQERIVGPGTGVFLLLWEGELLAAFCHRRLREKPPSGGVSVLRESVPLDPELLRSSRQLLERFGWQGVAMVEYKRDAQTNVPYLMEVNGRFWGSLQLAVDAGVDFPRLLVDAAVGEQPDAVTDYREGVRTRWLLGDVDHLWLRLGRSTDALPVGGEGAGKIHAVREFVSAFGPGSRNEVFRFRDPVPAFREMSSWLRRRG